MEPGADYSIDSNLYDTYNSNIESMQYGIKNLIEYPSTNRKVVVIGDMLELGENEEQYHKNIAKSLNHENISAIFAFGKLTRYTIKNISNQHIHKEFYKDKKKLIHDLKQFLNEDDIIYIKGSRSMKMEEIIMDLNK